MLDARRHRLDAQLEISRCLRLWDLGVERAPLGARLAPLHAKALLNAEPAAILAGPGIDRHVIGVHALVAELLRARVHDLEVVGSRHARIAVAARDAQALLGEL